MVYNYILWLTIILFPGRATVSQSETTDNNKIQWSLDRKLSWADFKGSPNSGSQFSAESSLQISYGLKIREESGVTHYSFTVDCYFEKSSSWVKDGKKTDKLLKHEQLHFDIAEYFARKLRREFENNSFNIDNYQSKSAKIFNKNFAEYQSFQAAYDAETHHGTKPEPQASWEERVKTLLRKSKAYKKSQSL
ncbi:DUF922 domain-containing protein [Fulvivirgaceae bacterium BMA12]|uniref:DUF922 domain-containing protein n=1 Tax=Agaribacillus aureus TaxID=3051825 RepID=A0ABT8L0N2_9BACT|nr:DUF922 domain-containing protein [Fulvivirgaceae bacterium BMA12]